MPICPSLTVSSLSPPLYFSVVRNFSIDIAEYRDPAAIIGADTEVPIGPAGINKPC